MIMSKFVNQLLAIYEIRDIETAFVQFFIDRNNIKVTRNNLIKSIIHNNKENIKSIKAAIKNYEPQDFDLYDLVNIFELLIPEKDRKLNGAFFTPKKITKFIVKNTIKSKNQTIYDPSCGCGAFLIETTDYINKKYRKKGTDIIENNIYGTDIAGYSIERAKILLTLLALQNNEDKAEILFNLNNVDSLESRLDQLYPKIIKAGGFDVVIGNPPYVKFQDLDIKTRGNLYTNWQTLKKGNYNLYFAFFELGMNVLKKDGILGYITPNNYFTSIAGVHLREYLESNRYINRIIDFNHLMLFDVQTYTCITFLKKTKKDYFYYEQIDNYENLNNLNHRIDYSRIKYSDLNNKKWRLSKDVDQENIRKIESAEHKLGSIVDIRVGIATCKDAIYFVDGNTQKAGYYQKKYNDKLYLIEHEITKPIVKISDYKDQEGLGQNKRRIIFPYKKVDGRVEVIPEDELKNNFPECYRYLLAAKDELATRDKGKIKYPQWYAYARTQGLNYFGEKLFTPTFSSKPRFLREKNPDTLFCNGYAVYLKQSLYLFPIIQNLDLDILSKLLNSKIMEYYIKRTSVSIEGGYPCYQKNFIELFGIPNFTGNEFKFLRDENNKEKIDEFLVKKYQVRF